ncbi:MAG: beta-N-acetylhexosaminidase [Pseudomonadota bacterium]
MANAFICGLRGLTLDDDERAFVRSAQPWGLILFGRNCQSPEQITRLIASFHEAVGWDAPVLIDQEGGLVQRLKAPHWQSYPPARQFGQLYDHSPEIALGAVRANARLIAHDLHSLGITINCAPVLDVAALTTHDAIGSRAYSADPDAVAALAGAAAAGFLEGGVLPVMKHMPGQGRAKTDTHFDPAIVDADADTLRAVDMRPFVAMRDCPIAMTCHVIFSAWDDRPVTTSRTIIHDIVRDEIGYDGLLLTDDISMKALGGTMAEKVSSALDAGCDLALHCNGDLAEAEAVAATAPTLTGDALRRANAALDMRRTPMAFDVDASRALLTQVQAA